MPKTLCSEELFDVLEPTIGHVSEGEVEKCCCGYNGSLVREDIERFLPMV
jgi:hypothetical protein